MEKSLVNHHCFCFIKILEWMNMNGKHMRFSDKTKYVVNFAQVDPINEAQNINFSNYLVLPVLREIKVMRRERGAQSSEECLQLQLS